MSADMAFCGTCGTANPYAAPPAPPVGTATGASTWTGVAPVVERPTEAMPATPPDGPPTGGPAAGPPSGPTTGGPGGPPGGPPPTAAGGKKSKGPLYAVAALVIAALAVGGFLVLGGGDDDEDASDETTTTEEVDDETTTTEAVDETTTTTEAVDETTTTIGGLEGIDFVPLTDASNRLTVEVPSTWTDQSLALDGADFANIQASTDLEAFRTGFDVPGMSFSLLSSTPAEGFDAVLDFLAASVNLPNACVTAGKDDYTDGVFTGRFEVWQECGGAGTQIVLIVASQADGQTIEINVQLPPGEPIEIVQHIAETFFIVG
jgi:hypothetical protein